MREPVRILITIEGGMISSICTLGVPVEAVVIDYDTDDASENDLMMIQQGDGSWVEARAYHEAAEAVDPKIMASVEELWCV